MLDIKRAIGSARIKISKFRRKGYNKFLLKAPVILAKNPSQKYVLLYLDIIQFKYINQAFSYNEGDKILTNIEMILKDLIQSQELYTRIYADHFAVLLKYEGIMQFEERLAFVENKLKELSKKTKEHYNILFRSGIYVMELGEKDITKCIDRANYAKCTIKNEICKNAYAYYTKAMVEKIYKEKELERVMGTAIERNSFEPYLQPKVNICTKEITGAEALVRWTTHENKHMHPKDFLPFFEKKGIRI